MPQILGITLEKINVLDLPEAIKEAKTFINYSGIEQSEKHWLIIYAQLLALSNNAPNENRIFEKVNIKYKTYENIFNNLWEDPEGRNLSFCSAGNLSKSSRNKLNRHRDKLGLAAINLGRLKIISQFIDLSKTNKSMNGPKFINAMQELNVNKDLSDSINYDVFYDISLIEAHSLLLLYIKKYSSKTVLNYFLYLIGKYWLTYSN